jgi:hypothetical protein
MSNFWDITPLSPLKANRRFGGAYLQKIEAKCSSRKSVAFQRTERRYIPEDRTLHNLESNLIYR